MSRQTYSHIYEPPIGDDPTTVILLHGTGGDARSFLEIGELVAPTAAKLSIDGNVDENGMARFFRRRAEGVYDMDDLRDRTAELDVFIQAALEAEGRDAGYAIGIGYSNGANILANLLFTAPHTVKRMILMHPLIPFEPAPDASFGGTSVLMTEGARDPIAPAMFGDGLEASLVSRGAMVDRYRHPGGHELRNEEISAARAWIAGLGLKSAA